MNYKNSAEAVKSFFLKYDPEMISMSKNYIDKKNIEIKESLTEKIVEILNSKEQKLEEKKQHL